MSEDRWWERACRGCGRPLDEHERVPSPIGWMHARCSTMPIPHTPPDAATLARITHRLAMLDGGPVVWLDGEDVLDVVGESFHFDQFVKLFGPPRPGGYDVPSSALLVPELYNPHDRAAVAVLVRSTVLGHLPRTVASSWSSVLLSLAVRYQRPIACSASVRGGILLREGRRTDYSVRLLLPDARGLSELVIKSTSHVVRGGLVQLVGDVEIDAVDESAYQGELEAIAGPRCAAGHDWYVTAVLDAGSVEARGIPIVVEGKTVAFIRQSTEVWTRVVGALTRKYGLPVAADGRITGGRGGAKGVRKTLYQVKLMLPTLSIDLLELDPNFAPVRLSL